MVIRGTNSLTDSRTHARTHTSSPVWGLWIPSHLKLAQNLHSALAKGGILLKHGSLSNQEEDHENVTISVHESVSLSNPSAAFEYLTTLLDPQKPMETSDSKMHCKCLPSKELTPIILLSEEPRWPTKMARRSYTRPSGVGGRHITVVATTQISSGTPPYCTDQPADSQRAGSTHTLKRLCLLMPQSPPHSRWLLTTKNRKHKIPLVIRPKGFSDLLISNSRQRHQEIVSVAGETTTRLKLTTTGAVCIDVLSETAASRPLPPARFEKHNDWNAEMTEMRFLRKATQSCSIF